jgi:hypothetical protein
VRYQNLKYVSFLLAFTLFWGIVPFIASASAKVDPSIASVDFIRVHVTGTNVNLRDQPSMKGHVLRQVSDSDDNNAFIAASQPIQDKSDGSTWYKLFFAVEPFDGSFVRFDKSTYLTNSQIPYINARFVKKVPLTEYDQEEIDYFRQGRPPRYRTGDMMDNLHVEQGYDAIVPIKKSVSLYLEPKETAKKQTFPAGTNIIVDNGPGRGGNAHDGQGGTSYWHLDMNDVQWEPVIGENSRIIGWLANQGIYEACFQ